MYQKIIVIGFHAIWKIGKIVHVAQLQEDFLVMYPVFHYDSLIRSCWYSITLCLLLFESKKHAS